MNYAKATKAKVTKSTALGCIQSQAELELNRRLNDEEVAYLLANTPPEMVQNQIEKVLDNDLM